MPDDGDIIDMLFSVKRVEERKEWLGDYVNGSYINYHSVKEIHHKDFFDKDFKLFSRSANHRTIPSLVDGFKPSQRKVFFSCFKRKLYDEIKLAGYVSEHSAYHHGEKAIQGCILNIAQDYVGANNINLLVPSGQFGTRSEGGKDSASARYASTYLHDLARSIFNSDDDHILDYLTDDGKSIEPNYYVPIIPLILVNGAYGIGTGWNSIVYKYNPLDLIENLRNKINNLPMEQLGPWFRDFKGEILANQQGLDGEVHLEVNLLCLVFVKLMKKIKTLFMLGNCRLIIGQLIIKFFWKV